MILNSIYELRINEVRDRGIPNKECIILRINTPINIGQFGIILGVKGPNTHATPIRDNFFWFGEADLNQGDWIFLYTGPGASRQNQLPNTNQFIYSIHWGRKETILHDGNVVPILFKLDSIQVGSAPNNLALPNKT